MGGVRVDNEVFFGSEYMHKMALEIAAFILSKAAVCFSPSKSAVWDVVLYEVYCAEEFRDFLDVVRFTNV